MYAVFETGGKQYKGAKGDIVWVEKLPAEPGKAVAFDALVVSDGDKVQIGTPTVKGVKVKARVVEHGKEKKVIVYKYKSKDNYRKKQGHRQPYTKIEITDIATARAAAEAVEAMEAEAAVEAAPKVKAAATEAKAAPKAKAAATEAKAAPKAKAVATEAKAATKAKTAAKAEE
jgi:ribosomal protein L21